MRTRLLLGALAVTAAASYLTLSRGAAFGGSPAGARLARLERSPQWRDGRFVNPQPLHNDGWGALVDFLFRGSEHRFPKEPVPTAPVDARRLRTPPATGLRVTWLGHSTLLVELDGRRVLVDPVWGPRASPFPWAGPRRFYPPLLPLAELPRVDAVVISHDHYDHLDLPTFEVLRGWDTTFVVPLGVGAHLEAWGVPPARIVELDWWEAARIGGDAPDALEITATPARHASGRGVLSGRDRTLWAGFALAGRAHRIWYSGDTGWFPALAEIGARLGPFDLAMVEAGAYGRAWPDWHIGPEGAVRASQEVRARVMLPVHWGLFDLAYHGWTEPAERVLAEARRLGVTVAIPRPGGSFEPEALPPLERWWPSLPWKTAAEDPIVPTELRGGVTGATSAWSRSGSP